MTRENTICDLPGLLEFQSDRKKNARGKYQANDAATTTSTCVII
jgi:hypothetical protein